MKVIRSIAKMQATANEMRKNGKFIGFVPTMGYLHDGHISLMRLASQHCDSLIVSIYVNPTQFAPNEDFNRYPRDFERDETICRNEQVDIIFYPQDSEIYPQEFQTYVVSETLSGVMCGRSRPHHFRGVTTIVTKLFNIVRPHLAVFGRKDAQQALILHRMVLDLNMNIEIITAPIIREKDGLAMSSRNKYLTDSERAQATVIYQSLQRTTELIKNGITGVSALKSEIQKMYDGTGAIRMDYIEIVDYENLRPLTQIKSNTLIAVAVYIGKVRLIDNILIKDLDPFVVE